jgi:vancomycin resistance protein YoaR
VVFGLVVLILVLFGLFSGTTMISGKARVKVFFDTKILLEKDYKIKTSTLMKVIFKNRANFNKFYSANKDNPHVRDFSCINEEIYSDLERVIKQVEYDSIDSRLIWDKHKAEFEIIEGKNGRIVNRNSLIENLYRNFGREINIELETEEIPQQVTKQELKKRCMERARFSTYFSSSSANRKHNIKTATHRLNGLKIAPNEVLSFNDAVGPRTAENGFLQSKIISGGAFITGTGGGVCQVSTTLFNAWVRAGLEVINAKNHSLKVSYVPPSMDAMVSSRTDLILKNNSPYDVYIKAYTQNDSVNVIIYGYEMKQRIELKSQIIKIIYSNGYDEIDRPVDWKEGETVRILAHPKNGLISAAYKEVYEGGRLVSSQKIRTNTYLAQRGKLVRRKIIPSEEKEKEPEESTFKLVDHYAVSGIDDRIAFLINLVSDAVGKSKVLSFFGFRSLLY